MDNKWKNMRKIDGHVHIMPIDRGTRNSTDKSFENYWSVESVENLLKDMEKNNVAKSVIVPINENKLYFGMRETSQAIARIVNKYPEKLIGFADLIINGAYGLNEPMIELEYAVKELGLKGLKIHPSNLNIPADDLRLVPILRKAAQLNIPVMFHSNPWGPGFYDMSAPHRINRMIKVFPDISFITSHLGGMRHLDAIKATSMVDISYAIFDLVDLYGIEITNNILRKIGAERLIFATDYPEYKYEEYFNILNKMDFSIDEIEKIAYNNMSKILGL